MGDETEVLEAVLKESIDLGKPPEWQDFVAIITLLVINLTILFIEENNTENAAAALMARLAPKAKVLRNGKWDEEDVVVLVPGDIISIKLGHIVPADARLLEGDPFKIDQALRVWSMTRVKVLVHMMLCVQPVRWQLSGCKISFVGMRTHDQILNYINQCSEKCEKWDGTLDIPAQNKLLLNFYKAIPAFSRSRAAPSPPSMPSIPSYLTRRNRRRMSTFPHEK